LINEDKRAASIFCVQECHFLTIKKQMYRELLMN